MKSWPPCFRFSIVARKNDLIFEKTSVEIFVSECGLGLTKRRESNGSN